ncbi:hypothetical protein BRADI_5g12630v3 [Brachypodium distachyon]|uniref:Uncharacterized protein n=1 Tax=Brachypodium distachyon TaxID=15368 RepID=I1IYJ9_BRADI|nr:hypothetical protein BRADI_5g12630v3 [Brachypodium distachyon]
MPAPCMVCSCLHVSGTELAERVCMTGISMNLVTYLTGDMHLSGAKWANIVTNFMGALNLLALLGGFLADAKLGHYLTIVASASATIAATGVSLLAASTRCQGCSHHGAAPAQPKGLPVGDARQVINERGNIDA